LFSEKSKQCKSFSRILAGKFTGRIFRPFSYESSDRKAALSDGSRLANAMSTIFARILKSAWRWLLAILWKKWRSMEAQGRIPP